MPPRHCILIAAFLLVLTPLAHADEWAKRWTVGGAPEFRVRTGDVSVVIEPGNDREISAEIKTRNVPVGPRGIRINEHQTGDAVDLEVRDPEHHFSFSFDSYSVELRIHVPRKTIIDSRSGDGSVHLSDMSGKIRIETGDGSIQADNLSGSFSALSGDGSVHANGRFDLLDVRTQDGSVEIRAESGSMLQRGWRIQTGDGSVRLTVPRDLSAELSIRTGDGNIHTDLPISLDRETDDHEVSGKLNGGGSLLEIRTGDGSVTLSAH